jgi:hypothetical protein
VTTANTAAEHLEHLERLGKVADPKSAALSQWLTFEDIAEIRESLRWAIAQAERLAKIEEYQRRFKLSASWEEGGWYPVHRCRETPFDKRLMDTATEAILCAGKWLEEHGQ